MQRRSFALGFCGVLLPVIHSSLLAQTLRKPVKVLCGFPAGGSADVVARLYTEALRGRFAESAVVENRTGAGARLAIQALKAAPGDGTTLLLSPTSLLTLYPHVYKRLGYDPVADLVPIASVARFPFAIAVRNDLPITNLAELAVWAKANADKATYGSPAAGASPHFLGQILADALGIKLTHIPYRGTGPAMQDLIGGSLAFVVSTVGDLVPNHHGNRLRIVGVSATSRLASLPEVATFAEQAIPRATLYESFGFFAPPNTTPAFVADASRALKAASVEKDLVDTLAKLEIQAEHREPAAFADQLRQETEWWRPVVKASGFQIDE
jgi:tripartite-type tricarboxylate transporter receptor subunit TctC